MRKTLLLILAAVSAFTIGRTYQDIGKALAIASAKTKGPTVRVPNVKPEVIERVKKFTVLISNEGFGGLHRGTGVLIDSRHVVTCAHLIATIEDDLYIYLYNGEVVKGKPVVGSVKKDIAIVKLDRPVKIKQRPVFQTKVLPGEPMAIVGNALGAMQWYVSGGVVSGHYRIWLLTDAFQIGGNSGGPWVNQKGEVIGLAAWGHARDNGVRTGVNGAVDAKTVYKFIWEYRNPPKTMEEFFQRMIAN